MATDTPQAARNQAVRKALREHARVVWANRLESRMSAMGVKPQALADGAGTTYQTIWKILRGDLYPQEYLRVSIALTLGAEVDDIFPMPDRAAIAAATGRAA